MYEKIQGLTTLDNAIALIKIVLSDPLNWTAVLDMASISMAYKRIS